MLDFNAAIARSPLIDRVCEFRPQQRLIAEADVDPVADPFLAGHCLKGTPFIPAAFVLELFSQASLLLADGMCVQGLCEIEFVNGIRFFTDDPATIQLEVVRSGDRTHCEMRADFRNTKGKLVQADRLCTKGTVLLADRAAESDTPPLEQPAEPWVDLIYSEVRRNYFGPEMRCLRRVVLRPDGGWAEIQVPADLSTVGGRRTGEGWILHPAVFDACLVASNVLTEALFEEQVQIPYTYGHVSVFRRPRPGELGIVRFHKHDHQADATHYDFAFYGPDGRAITSVTGYRCHLIDRPDGNLPSIDLGPNAPQLR